MSQIKNDIVVYKPCTKDIYEAALDLVDTLPEKMLNDFSDDQEDSRISGYCGQLGFKEIFPEADMVDMYKYDFIFKGKKVEVKTNNNTYEPKPWYLGDVPEHSYKNEYPDIWCFMACVNFRRLYIMGYMTAQEFKDKSEIRKAGDPEPIRPGWFYKGDCRVYPYELMIPPKEKGTGQFWNIRNGHYHF